MLEQIYDDYLLKKDKAEKREERISLSGIGKCIRYLMMMDKGGYDTVEPDKYQRRTFQHGKIIENDLTEAIKSEGKLTAKQVNVVYKGIPGTLDWIVHNPTYNCNYLYDGKTAKESSFQYLDKLHNEMSEDYKYQLTGYWCSDIADENKKSTGVKLAIKYQLNKMVRIAYVSKDNSLFYEPHLLVEEFKPKLDQRVKDIEMWRTSGDLPPEKTEWEKNSWGKDAEGKKLKITEPTSEVGFPCFTLQKEQYTKRVVDVKIWCSKLRNCPTVYAKYKEACKKHAVEAR
jgi:hypothetical protein